MISLVSYYARKILYGSSEDPVPEKTPDEEDDPDEDVENLLERIEEIRKPAASTKCQSNLNYTEDDVGCFYKTGKVSLVHHSYVLVDNKYFCEMKYVIPENLKVGDKVYYQAYKVHKGEELKIHKIINKINLEWNSENDFSEPNIEPVNHKNGQEFQIQTVNNNIELDTHCTDQEIEKKDSMFNSHKVRNISRQVHVGKVERRSGRIIFLADNTCINLDDVSSDFVPVIGDWIQLDCLVEVNEEVPNFKGDILEIEAIKPHRQLNKVGIVSDYKPEMEYGVIDKTIVFSKAVCMPGYIPCIGDKIVVQSIESDQGTTHRWRAMSVVPIEDVHNKFEISSVKYKPQLPAEELNELLRDKENVTITNDIRVTLDVKEEKDIEVTIKNDGNSKLTIYKCSFFNKKPESQLRLLSPANTEPIILKPSEDIIYTFKCKAKLVGVTRELVIFKFKQFKVARIFHITVNSINPKNNQVCKENIYNAYKNNGNSQTIIPQTFEEGQYIKGIKPYKPAKFIPVRPVTWKIPPILWSTIDSIIIQKKTRTESEFALVEVIPCLQQPLNFNNYKQRFDYLLYLEEIALILEMQRFSMESAILHKSGEFLMLNVPGLAEKRPSLIVGDRVIVNFKWIKDSKHYEGYIHKIRSSDIFLKFNQSFHQNYNGEDCHISFKASTTVLQRCHAAIAAVRNSLGQDFLFPRKVLEKEPQYYFTDKEDTDEEELTNGFSKLKCACTVDEKVKLVESMLYRRKIKWFQKKLNVYQKEAIKNILKGVARPLPYVIFGPPGTGKTITVVEAILQIFYTITESRILIATPSNSSANLIAERLLDAGVLKPGNMVRLVAHHYMESDLIPEQLLPYCMTAEISEEGTRSAVNQSDDRGCTTQATLRTLARHRIIVGTCAALGILYNMGCKPGHFSHIFVDEAGQASEPEIMIPLSLAHASSSQVILAGDPKQLGPINQSRLAGYFGLSDSFLVRLLQQFPYQKDSEGFVSGYDPRLITKLLMNYRSLPDLLELPNKLFYESELIPQVDPDESEEAELLQNLADLLPKRLGAPPSVVFHGVNGRNMQDPDSPSWYNPEEATQVYIYLLQLYNEGLQPDDIGIITPYSKQVHRIKSLLAQLEIESPKVGSVEEFQGQERKIIILSTVRTAEDKVNEDIKHSLGFVASRERLNVAITRARTLLIIIGSAKLLQQDVYWRSVIEHCASRCSLIGVNRDLD